MEDPPDHAASHKWASRQGEHHSVSEWMQQNQRVQCRVCGMCVASSRGIHPTCRPRERTSLDQGRQPRDGDDDDDDDDPVLAASDLPSLSDVMSCKVGVLEHVPKPCRHSWAQILTRALARACTNNTVEAWTEFLMLPKAVLLAPPRGGKKHKQTAAAFTADRLCQWEAGERGSLWESLPSPANRMRSKTSDEQKAKIAVALCRQGFDRKACAALIATDVCEENSETAQNLKSLHPEATPPSCSPISELPWCSEISPGMVHKVLKKFPLDSAPGPSGLRVQHLLEALIPFRNAMFLEQLAQAVKLLAQGTAPEALGEHLAGAKLHDLEKPKGRIRLIAIGEILRRVVGKCLCVIVKEEAQKFFEPLQVGVACCKNIPF